MSGINFLRQQRTVVETQVRKDKKIARYTGIGLGIFLAIVVGIVIVRAIFEIQYKQTATSLDTARKKIATFAKIESSFIVFAKKVQLMEDLDKQRAAKRQAVQFFYTLIPPEDVIQQVNLDTKNARIVFQISSPDVFRMLALLRTVREKATSDTIYLFQISSLTRKPDGSYLVGGALSYDQKALSPAKSLATPAPGKGASQ
jgi:predicted small secreted protein